MSLDVCLVNMPFSSVVRPSLALGLLHALLEKEKIRATTLYANLLFAEQINSENYMIQEKTKSEDVLGEWFFVPAAFPKFTCDDTAYIKRLRERNRLLKIISQTHLRKLLIDIREEATRFTEKTTSRILDSGARIVGCTSTFQQHVASLAVLRQVKKQAPDTITLLGGANCETIMGKTTHENFPWVDYVISGEADTFMSEFCGRLLDRGRDLNPKDLPQGVFGPVHRREGYPANQGHRWNTWRATTESLEELPPPNYDDYFDTLNKLPKLREAVRPGLLFETSRGCWWGERRGCTFCGLNGAGKPFRRKSPGKILKELDFLSKKHRIKDFEATDNLMDIGLSKTLLPALKKERNYNLFFETRSRLQQNQLKLFADAGIRWIQPGIESLHTKILTLMNKGCKAYHNIQFLKWCRLAGIRASWNILHGFPEEEDAWYREMAALVPLITHLQPPTSMVQVRFDRYSAFHRQPEVFGLVLAPFDAYHYIYPLPEDKLADQAYFFNAKNLFSLQKNTVLPILLNEWGYREIVVAVSDWQNLFWHSEIPPALQIYNKNDEVFILDTRRPDKKEERRLSDIERAILKETNRAVPKGFLESEMIKSGYTKTDLQNTLETLIMQGIILPIDGRFLSLALEGMPVVLPHLSDFPGGGLKWEEKLLRGQTSPLLKESE